MPMACGSPMCQQELTPDSRRAQASRTAREMLRTPSCVANVWMSCWRSPSTSGRSCGADISPAVAARHADAPATHLGDGNDGRKHRHKAGDEGDRRAPLRHALRHGARLGRHALTHLERKQQRRARSMIHAEVEQETTHGGNDHEGRQREALRCGLVSSGCRRACARSQVLTFRRNGGTLYSVPRQRPKQYKPCEPARQCTGW